MLKEAYSGERIFLEVKRCTSSKNDEVSKSLSCLNFLMCQRKQVELVIPNFPLSLMLIGFCQLRDVSWLKQGSRCCWCDGREVREESSRV